MYLHPIGCQTTDTSFSSMCHSAAAQVARSTINRSLRIQFQITAQTALQKNLYKILHSISFSSFFIHDHLLLMNLRRFYFHKI